MQLRNGSSRCISQMQLQELGPAGQGPAGQGPVGQGPVGKGSLQVCTACCLELECQ